MKSAVAWFGASRAGLAWKRYSNARGNLLAGGVGYFAFFSLFPATALALTVFGFALRGHPDLLRTILAHLGTYLPGLVKDVRHPQGLIPVQPPTAVALTIAGVIAFVVLIKGIYRTQRPAAPPVPIAPPAPGVLVVPPADEVEPD